MGVDGVEAAVLEAPLEDCECMQREYDALAMVQEANLRVRRRLRRRMQAHELPACDLDGPTALDELYPGLQAALPRAVDLALSRLLA